MNRLKQLETCGQSPWLDYLRRSLIEKGELRHLIARNELKGVTSVPADVITAAPFTRFRTRRPSAKKCRPRCVSASAVTLRVRNPSTPR